MTAELKSAVPGIAPGAYAQADRIRESFLQAKPFKHVIVEEFFDPDFAERLLAEFPSFDPRLARSEHGQIGGKAVNTKIATIGPAYEELYRLLSSPPFLDYVSRLSGVDDLILDPAMYGGGTHENRHGQELDAHVDFNFDQDRKLHRRLNLIVYLNKGWRPEWGGGIEIHSNPRKPEENRIQIWDPLFNRAILFETNEYSWHGFPRIDLPEDKRSLSRKSISIYLYTRDRPAEEIAPAHSTFYVQRPLPAYFVPGYTLTAADVVEVKGLLTKRDRWIENYQNKELETSRHTAGLHGYIDHLESSARIPLTGYIRQEGKAAGFHADLWCTPSMKVRLAPTAPVSGFKLRGVRPEGWGPGTIRVLVNGQQLGRREVGTGAFIMDLRPPARLAQAFDFEVQFDGPLREKTAGGDQRDLAWMLMELRALHPLTALLKRQI